MAIINYSTNKIFAIILAPYSKWWWPLIIQNYNQFYKSYDRKVIYIHNIYEIIITQKCL